MIKRMNHADDTIRHYYEEMVDRDRRAWVRDYMDYGLDDKTTVAMCVSDWMDEANYGYEAVPRVKF